MRVSLNQVIVGPDGSGRTHALRVAVSATGGSVIDLSPRSGERDTPGSVIRRVLELGTGKLPTVDALRARLSSFDVVAIDDAHWLDDQSAELLTGVANADSTLVIARRPQLAGPAQSALDEATGRNGSTIVLQLLTGPEIAERFNVDQIRAESLRRQTLGLAGLVALLVAEPGVQLIDTRVQRRLGLFRPTTVDLVQVRSALHPGEVDDETLAEVLKVDMANIVAASDDAAQAGFLIGSTSQLVPVLGARVLAQLDAARRRALHRRLAQHFASIGRADPLLLAAQWRDSGSSAHDAGQAFLAAGRATTDADPNAALEWFGLALEAGAPAGDAWLGRAEVSIRLGAEPGSRPVDLTAEELNSAELIRARRFAQLGQWPEATSVLDSVGARGAAALVPTLIIGGALDRAQEIVASRSLASPDPVEVFDAACISAIVSGSTSMELADAAHAVRAAKRSDEVTETPEVLAALAVSICAPADSWREALGSVPRVSDIGALARVADRRLVLTEAFLDVRRGNYELGRAASALFSDEPVRGRDAALLFALRAALARRAVRPEMQLEASRRADEVKRWVAADPFSTEIAEELLVTAARHNDEAWMRAGIDQLRLLSRGLGDGSPWHAQIAWTLAQIAIAASDSDLLGEADRLLTNLPWPTGSRPWAYGLSVRCWTDVLGRRPVDPVAAERAAGALGATGLRYEASQLLGQVALDIPFGEGEVVVGLLVKAHEIGHPTPLTGELPDIDDGEPSLLSAREREVAELKFLGHKNQVIAERLFIGVKTVETYVTRINAKFNAANRAEFIDVYGKYRTRKHLAAQ
jgi:DNA-binding CsgD family transcriptional regulator